MRIETPALRRALEETYDDNDIRDRREGSLKTTRLVKLLFGSQAPATVNRYADVLAAARRHKLTPASLFKLLEKHGIKGVAAGKVGEPKPIEKVTKNARKQLRHLKLGKFDTKTAPSKGQLSRSKGQSTPPQWSVALVYFQGGSARVYQLPPSVGPTAAQLLFGACKAVARR